MSSANWQKVSKLFHQALECPAEERERFLREVCGDDLDLRRTVESLLEADAEAGEFLEFAPLIAMPSEDRDDGRE